MKGYQKCKFKGKEKGKCERNGIGLKRRKISCFIINYLVLPRSCKV